LPVATKPRATAKNLQASPRFLHSTALSPSPDLCAQHASPSQAVQQLASVACRRRVYGGLWLLRLESFFVLSLPATRHVALVMWLATVQFFWLHPADAARERLPLHRRRRCKSEQKGLVLPSPRWRVACPSTHTNLFAILLLHYFGVFWSQQGQ
jgi:hypothetical protein